MGHFTGADFNAGNSEWLNQFAPAGLKVWIATDVFNVENKGQTVADVVGEVQIVEAIPCDVSGLWGQVWLAAHEELEAIRNVRGIHFTVEGDEAEHFVIDKKEAAASDDKIKHQLRFEPETSG